MATYLTQQQNAGDRRRPGTPRTGINILLGFKRRRMDTSGWVGPAGGSGLAGKRCQPYVRLSVQPLKVFIRQTQARGSHCLPLNLSFTRSVSQSCCCCCCCWCRVVITSDRRITFCCHYARQSFAFLRSVSADSVYFFWARLPSRTANKRTLRCYHFAYQCSLIIACCLFS